MKRQATPEQKAARAEKIGKMRTLAALLGKMDEAQRQQIIDTHPITTIEGRTLSPLNQCMIAMQLPRATVTGGFAQWIAAGRAVRKGEHGACIWIPCKSKGSEAAAPDATAGEVSTDEGRTRFTLGTVFDIAQTDPKESEVPA